MPSGTYIRTEKTREKLSKGLRNFHRKKKISDGLKEFHRKKKIAEDKEKKQEAPDGRDKSDGTSGRIENLDREQLMDAFEGIRNDILARVRMLTKYWNGLMSMQERRDELEERLEKLGMTFKD